MTADGLALPVEKERQEAEDKASRLLDALLDAIDELEDMVGYVPEYFREKWGYDEAIARLKERAGVLS